MGWLRRLFGPRVPALRFPRSGEYSERIVGEASYQAAIERLAGGSPEDGSSCDIPVTAELIWEDDNPADDEAIQVQVQGMVVGYLTRTSARLYRRWMATAGYQGRRAVCGARIVGGRDRGPRGRGYFGVELDVPAFYGPVSSGEEGACDDDQGDAR